MRLKLTDGRPWYKQAVSGLILSIVSVILIPVIITGVLIAYSILSNTLVIDTLISASKAIAILIAILSVMKLFEWATD